MAMRHEQHRLLVVFLLAGVFLLALTTPALAVTFSNASPAQPEPILVEHMNNVQLSVYGVATSGQTIAQSPTLVIDGGAPITLYASYRVDHWEPYYDGEYGEWYDIPIYDYTEATFSSSQQLPVGGHSAVLTVRELPSNATFTYTWTFPAENCKSCHDDQPLAHATGNFTSAQCSLCHGANSPIQAHNGGFGACGNCHGGAHGAERLAAHTYYDLDGNPYDRAERACTKCHNPTYAQIPQLGENHGDPSAAHAGIAEAACAGCHGTDVVTLQEVGGCDTCHGATDPPAGATCSTCHDD
ncbi:MAG TPA: hypothetical protein VLA05_09200, partial [Coriobacteriia bacterium]|nr:hypothetical protein [Coriobacteriia bacterium]